MEDGILKVIKGWSVDLVTNDNLRNTLTKYNLPKVSFTTIKNVLGQGKTLNVDMNAEIIYPPDFDPSGVYKYPVMFRTYGGPDSQTARQKYEFDFMKAISSLDVICIIVDGIVLFNQRSRDWIQGKKV